MVAGAGASALLLALAAAWPATSAALVLRARSSDVGAGASAEGAGAGGGRAAAALWPKSLSLTMPQPLPRRTSKLPAEDDAWYGEQQRWRQALWRDAKQRRDAIRGLFRDDTGSNLYKLYKGETVDAAAQRIAAQTEKEASMSEEEKTKRAMEVKKAAAAKVQADKNYLKTYNEFPAWKKKQVQQEWNNKLAAEHKAVTEAKLRGQLSSEDGAIWVPLEDFSFAMPDPAYWKGVCDGTNETWVKAMRAAAGRPLDDWLLTKNTSCSAKDTLEGGEFEDEREAWKACGAGCASIVDDGCVRERFKLCGIGSQDLAVANSTCLRRKPPNAPPPAADLDKPKEDELWKLLCTQAGPPYRVVWEQRECANADAVSLVGAESPDRCAELAGENKVCGKLFEFTKVTPPTCRCIPAYTRCETRLVDLSIGVSNVYLLMNHSDPHAAFR